MDGTVERLLNDNEIGWHAGDWKVNCHSVAICLDNDFENAAPSNSVLSAVAKLIKTHYPHTHILGHREINPQTTCPGNLFLPDWKKKLIQKATIYPNA